MTEADIPARAAEILPPITDPTVHREIARLARLHEQAGGVGMQVLHIVGGGAEKAIDKVPERYRARIDRLTRTGLEQAVGLASVSRRVVRDRGEGFDRVMATASGAAGGLFGIVGAMVELPATVAMLMRAMLGVAAEHGLDADSDLVRRECLRIFAVAGPMADDDATDLGLLAARLSITGQSLSALVARVAPRLAASLGPKLVAQSVPVLGAVAGGAINYAFASYYQQLARVHFGLMRLADETGLPREALTEALRLAIEDSRRGVARG